MLDAFEILTTSGVVLWSRAYVPIGANIINSLIKDVFIEERHTPGARATDEASAMRNPSYKKDKYTLKWTTAKDLGLIFVAVYQSLIHLSWIDKLLDNVKILFTSLYGTQCKKPHTSIVDCPFDDYFDRQMQDLEQSSGGGILQPADLTPTTDLTPSSSSGTDYGVNGVAPPMPGIRKDLNRYTTLQTALEGDTRSTEVTPIPTPDSSRAASPASHLLTVKITAAGRSSRRTRKAAGASTSVISTGSKGKVPTKAEAKMMRRWDDHGMIDESDDKVLDYSAPTIESINGNPVNDKNSDSMAPESFGQRTGNGEVILKDLEEEMDSILSSAAEKQSTIPASASGGIVNSSIGAISGLFRSVVGGKILTKEDLVKPLKGMEEHLINKNVAREAALRLCDAVQRDLLGTKTASFQSIETTIRSSMEKALSRILTPSTSLDLLRSIQAVISPNSSILPPAVAKRPYVLSVVGVNGVGKSTTLAKLAFLLLHNNLRVLVCAADTFRSGAIEQLRVHVRNLQSLSSSSSGMGHIDLFERGYGKDAAHIARDAVAYASSPAAGEEPFDVVLIDTAGRRHNDARLMSSLEKFATLANPDKILMVGEALVGTDSVAQARHFNESFGPGRGLDGFIVSKCDTVGEMVGTLVSMVHATGVPVVALGVGQHYGDLRGFNVGWATRLLMQ